MAKKKSQPQSALPFFIMAVFAFMAGFPIWLAFVLVLIGIVVLKIEKDKKALSKLPPLPPAQADGTSNTASPFQFPLPMPEPSGEQTPDAGSLDPVPPSQPQSQPQPRQQPQPQSQSFEPVSYQEPTPAPEALPWMTPSPQTHGATHRAAIGNQPAVLSTTQIRANNIYSSGLKPRQTSRFATSLRGRESARQAIVAMTVLGRPRALQPYEFDPIEQTDVAPGRPAK